MKQRPITSLAGDNGEGSPEGARRATEGESSKEILKTTPDPEILEKPVRRRFSAEYKLRILKEADACTEPGQIGALLRREGLYSSNLTCWRRQREDGILSALKPAKRGRKAKPENPLDAENKALLKENRRLKKKLKHAETIIDIQKKISEMLAIPLSPREFDENDS